MKIIICGAGQVGLHLATYLSKAKHSVTVVDQSQDLFGQINDELDVRAIVGQGSMPDILENAGANDTDLLIAVTQLDEVNIVACQVAHSIFNIPTKIARIRNQQYLDPKWSHLFNPQHVPIDHVISPEVAVADTIFRRVRVAGAFNSILLPPARVIGLHVKEDCPLINTPLRQLTSLFPDLAINILAILRKGKMIIPTSHDQILIDDSLYFLTDETHIIRSMSAFGIEEQRAKRAIIIGGGNIGINLAKLMSSAEGGYKVTMIERSKEQANHAVIALPNMDISCGDGLNANILNEAGLAQADLAICVTNNDETNILSALLCKHLGIKRTVALNNKGTYGSLTTKLGVDVMINPREITASTILQFIRRGKVSAIYSVFDGMAEILQIEAMEGSTLIGMKLKESPLPDKSIIGGIIRNDKLIIPRPDTSIERGDHVVLLSAVSEMKQIEKLFSAGIGYF